MIAQRIDHGLLGRFDHALDPRHPEKSPIPAKVLGYGEISTIFEILHESQQGLAYKRMPIFRAEHEIDRYERLFREYNRLLADEIGIAVPDHASARVHPKRGNRVVYIVQEKLHPESLCHRLIHRLDQASAEGLLLVILRHMQRVWEFNARGGPLVVGLDGQLSNWAMKGYDPGHPRIFAETELTYIDTSTPLLRINGVEQLDSELFLRSAPSFLVWIIRAFFLKGVLDRYYDFHLVVVDLIANLHKEQRPELIPGFIAAANGFFSREAPHLAVAPITAEEVAAYYREDAFIWRLFLALRKLDRFLSTRILRRPYPYILPGKIRR